VPTTGGWKKLGLKMNRGTLWSSPVLYRLSDPPRVRGTNFSASGLRRERDTSQGRCGKRGEKFEASRLRMWGESLLPTSAGVGSVHGAVSGRGGPRTGGVETSSSTLVGGCAGGLGPLLVILGLARSLPESRRPTSTSGGGSVRGALSGGSPPTSRAATSSLTLLGNCAGVLGPLLVIFGSARSMPESTGPTSPSEGSVGGALSGGGPPTSGAATSSSTMVPERAGSLGPIPVTLDSARSLS
jgi:hypothetical protein